MSALSALPEELLERILVLHISSFPHQSWRPVWHLRNSVASILLVNKQFLRIATPLLYRSVVLHSPSQFSLLLNALRANPELTRHIRSIAISGGSYKGVDELVRICRRIQVFDMTLDSSVWEEDAKAQFCSSLKELRGIKHLVIRKDAYLTQEKPKYMIAQLSQAIPNWSSLESIDLKFKFSSDPASCCLASALAIAPKLKSFRALLPSVWNPALLIISQNPSLERIHLSPINQLFGSHLFLTEARNHGRLMELIKAGTPIMRTRAVSSPSMNLPLRMKTGVLSYSFPPVSQQHVSHFGSTLDATAQYIPRLFA